MSTQFPRFSTYKIPFRLFFFLLTTPSHSYTYNSFLLDMFIAMISDMSKLETPSRLFMTEVAPPKYISISRRPLAILATIDEEDKDFNAIASSMLLRGSASLQLSIELERPNLLLDDS
ncbi:hypothetical protein ACFE04_010941 [Oxalis oulophora]